MFLSEKYQSNEATVCEDKVSEDKVSDPSGPENRAAAARGEEEMKREGLKWRDRKRNFLGLPWTFTIYSLDEKRLFIETGVFNKTENEVRLYRVIDLSLTRNLWQRIIRTGTIHCVTADRTMKNFDIKNVKQARDAKEILSELVEQARRENRVYAREDMHTESDSSGPVPEIYDHDPIEPELEHPEDQYDPDADGDYDDR